MDEHTKDEMTPEREAAQSSEQNRELAPERESTAAPSVAEKQAPQPLDAASAARADEILNARTKQNNDLMVLNAKWASNSDLKKNPTFDYRVT